MRRATVLLAFAAVLVGFVRPCAAQARERVSVAVSGASQLTRHPFNDRFTFDVNRESGSTDTRYPVEGGTAVDGSVSVRVWKGLGLGVGLTTLRRDVDTQITSRIPHPFFFAAARELDATAGAPRTERSVHVQALYRLPLARALTLAVFGGPSFVRVEQDVVTPGPGTALAAGVRYDEAFPYDSVTFRSANLQSARGSGPAFHAGVDVAWMFNRNLGVGALARYTAVTVDLDLPPDGARRKSVAAGGAVAGGGLRLAF